jgi:hypothetical protein
MGVDSLDAEDASYGVEFDGHLDLLGQEIRGERIGFVDG